MNIFRLIRQKFGSAIWLPVLAMSLVLAVLAGSRWISVKTLVAHNLAYNPSNEEPTTKPASLNIQIPVSTLNASTPNQISIPPVADVPDSVSKVTVEIDGHPLPRTIAASELKRGTTFSFTPNKAGQFHVAFLAGGHQLASAPVVAVARAGVPSQPFDFQLVADRDNVKYMPGAGFVLPIAVQSSIRGVDGVRTPTACIKQTLVAVTDSTANPPHELVLRAGAALSTSFDLPLSPALTYHLLGRLAATGSQPFDAIDVSWSTHGPKLQLQATPPIQTTYSTAQTPAHISVNYAYQGLQVEPPVPASIVGSASSANVHLLPGGQVTIDSAHPLAAIEASDGSSGETATITFVDPLFGTIATSTVRYQFPTESLFVAMVCGAIGVLVLLVFSESLHSNWRTFLRAAVGMIGGLLAYLMIISAWLPYPGVGSPIGLLPAALIGLLGGYGGQTIWEVGATILRPGSGTSAPTQ